MQYVKSLDGLRGVAILLVIFRHWHLPGLNIELGWIGVNLFFVLSGFLISSILLEDKSKYQFGGYLKLFYWKRLLRIFPNTVLYFNERSFELSILSIAYDHLKVYWLNLLTYTYNFHHYVSMVDGYRLPATKVFGHLWSLSVEEQFYLLFPVIIYFLRKRSIQYLSVVIIIIGPILRFFFGHHFLELGYYPHQVGLTLYKGSIFQMDSLALGVLLSTVSWNRFKSLTKGSYHLSLIFVLSMLFVLSQYLVEFGLNINVWNFSFQLLPEYLKTESGNFILDSYFSWMFTVVNIVFAWVLIGCIKGWNKLFELKPLIRLGKISYGLYLYHNIIYYLFEHLLRAYLHTKNLTVPLYTEIILFLVYFVVIFFISSWSYRLIEAPLLRFKGKFQPKTIKT
jgi:peptidoglycan/LPS O-acetylase OafA/YrhL